MVINSTHPYDYSISNYSGSRNVLFPPAISSTLLENNTSHRFAFYKASGGNISPFFSENLSGSNSHILPIHNQKLTYIVQKIQSAFDLTIDELAKVFQVGSRKTIYNWIKSETIPHKNNLERIFKFSVIADEWIQLGFSFKNKDLRKPIIDGKNIIDLLAQDEVNSELILFGGSRLNLIINKKTLKDPFA